MYGYKDQFIPKMQTLKIKDSTSLGVIGGLLGTISLNIANLLFWKGKKTKTSFGQLAGSIFMKGYRTKQRKNFIFGETVHLLTGALAGIPLVYLFKATGKDHQITKGAAYGTLVWMAYYVLGVKAQIFHSPPKRNRAHFSSLWLNLIFGVSAAKAIVSLGHPSIFPQHDSKAVRGTAEKQSIGLEPWTLPHYTDYDTEKTLH